uniref:Thymic stromal cotransporter homolog n=1 Tax=Sus scrofa TaxID=9823 RepID=A0A480IVS0_PIG
MSESSESSSITRKVLSPPTRESPAPEQVSLKPTRVSWARSRFGPQFLVSSWVFGGARPRLGVFDSRRSAPSFLCRVTILQQRGLLRGHNANGDDGQEGEEGGERKAGAHEFFHGELIDLIVHRGCHHPGQSQGQLQDDKHLSVRGAFDEFGHCRSDGCDGDESEQHGGPSWKGITREHSSL